MLSREDQIRKLQADYKSYVGRYERVNAEFQEKKKDIEGCREKMRVLKDKMQKKLQRYPASLEVKAEALELEKYHYSVAKLCEEADCFTFPQYQKLLNLFLGWRDYITAQLQQLQAEAQPVYLEEKKDEARPAVACPAR